MPNFKGYYETFMAYYTNAHIFLKWNQAMEL